jgi:hypothetical protein
MGYLAEIVRQLTTTITDILADRKRIALDEEGESRLMPSVELIALLCERYQAIPPREKIVQQWRKKYLKVFDQQVESLAPPADLKLRRRKVIDNTFEWLEGLSKIHWTK